MTQAPQKSNDVRRPSNMDALKNQIALRFQELNKKDAGSSDENESSDDDDSYWESGI